MPGYGPSRKSGPKSSLFRHNPISEIPQHDKTQYPNLPSHLRQKKSWKKLGRQWTKEKEQNYQENKEKILSNISKHKFERNLYEPTAECTSMNSKEAKKWRKTHKIEVIPGYDDLQQTEPTKQSKQKKGKKQKLQNKGKKQNKKGHFLKGKIPNPVLEFDHIKWPNAEDITSNLKKVFNKPDAKPTPIQSATWPLLLSGLNVIGIAKTGSGKTLAFLLPAIVHMRAQPMSKEPRVLIVLPTRELAIQVGREIPKFGGKAVRFTCVYGGVRPQPQLKDIRRGKEIVVATPGRLMDFVTCDEINLGMVTFVVWDEADRLLDMGFKPQLDRIMEVIRTDKQMVMFSATWPKKVRKLAQAHVLDKQYGEKNVVQVAVGSLDTFNANENITQKIIVLKKDSEKQMVLYDFIAKHRNSKILIFMGTTRMCLKYEETLTNAGYTVGGMHGKKKLKKRKKALRDFKHGKVKILFATDVAGRGIHVDDIDYVINYDLPDRGFEDYIHRIGRTGRAGKKGIAISYFVPEYDCKLAQKLVTVLEAAKQHVPPELRNMQMKKRMRYMNR